MKYLSLFALLFLGSCSTSHKLSQEAIKIKIAKTKPMNCSVVGKYKGIHKEGSVELARNQAVNLSAKDGATHIFFNEEINNGQTWNVHATGYMCR